MSDTSPPGQGPSGPEGPEDVGSVGEEALKLFGALSDWAREHGADLGHGLAAVGSHVDTGARECDWCPVCRTVHLVRETSPEVRDHLASAAASLLQAAAGVLAATSRGARTARSGSVERIDLDQDADEWPEDQR